MRAVEDSGQQLAMPLARYYPTPGRAPEPLPRGSFWSVAWAKRYGNGHWLVYYAFRLACFGHSPDEETYDDSSTPGNP
jgi:hypothetical protein